MQERFSMKDLLRHKDIVIQCHDFPDADTIATAFAVYEYLKMYDNYAKIIFSGKGQIVKPALIKMVQQLKIPIEYVETPPPVKTLITVDCQYGAGNVTHIDAEKVFIIDHHEDKNLGLDGEIRSQLGSCATLVWDLLVAEGFPIMKNLATALYYGLYTDTGGFDEIGHPLDRDMRDTLSIDKAMLDSLRYSSFTLSELTIAGTALIRHNVNTHYKFAIFRSEPCDPNILGFINDLALQTEGLDVCIVYAHVSGGYKLSVRSCTRTTMANELASFLAGGGGHRQKAGGFIPQCDVENIDQFLEARTLQYFEQYDMVEAANHDLDVFSMAAYKKLNISVAYARSEDCFPEGSLILVRTLEGDIETVVSPNIYLMIGPLGEVYPIRADKHKLSYVSTEIPFDDKRLAYAPTIRNRLTGEVRELLPISRPCVASGNVTVFVKCLDNYTKVFTAWNPDGYMHGEPGDYLVVRSDDHNDVYIARRDIFDITYAPI